MRAAIITKEEYHLLFYYLEAVSEASEALTERMSKYIESGLLTKENSKEDYEKDSRSSANVKSEEEPQSILSELIQEGILNQRDVDIISNVVTSEYTDVPESCILDDNDKRSSVSSGGSSHRKIVVDCNESVIDGSIVESVDNITTVTINSKGKCCTDHRISADAADNVWANVRWHFLNPSDFGYDQVRSVKRSRSDSALTPVSRRRNEEIYETLRDDDEHSSGSITPYESIEDLYDCIKNSQYNNGGADESSPSTESHSEPRYPEYYDKSSTTRQSSTSSEKSGASSAFPFSKCGSSDSASAFASCESTSGVSTFISKNFPGSLKGRELPPPPTEEEASESVILLRQLFTGELLDAYAEFLVAYPYARALLRQKMRRDEHFVALADIRRGAGKHSIIDYLELPVSNKLILHHFSF